MQLRLYVIMVEHKAILARRPFTCRMRASKAATSLSCREQHVGDERAFEVSPQPLDQVQARAVRRQPVDLDQMRCSPSHAATALVWWNRPLSQTSRTLRPLYAATSETRNARKCTPLLVAATVWTILPVA